MPADLSDTIEKALYFMAGAICAVVLMIVGSK